MKKPLTFICLLIANYGYAYKSHEIYQSGDTHLVNFNLVLADLSLENAQLFFPTEQDLKDWLLENDGSKVRINRTPGRIVGELAYRIEPGQGEVIVNDHNRFPPYYLAYLETADNGATWKVICEWTNPLSAGLLIETILADDTKKLLEMPPLEVVGLDFEIKTGPGKVVVFTP